MWMEDSFFNLVGLIRVMAVLATSQPMPLQQQRYLELMQAVGLLIWCIPLWACLLLVRRPNISFVACFNVQFFFFPDKQQAYCDVYKHIFLCFFLSRIALCGSEAQKQKYLPDLAQMKTVTCWVSTSRRFAALCVM